VNLLKVEPGSVSEIHPTSHDGNQINDVKVEEDPVPIEFPGIKSEPEVSFMSEYPLLGTFHRHLESSQVVAVVVVLYQSVDSVDLEIFHRIFSRRLRFDEHCLRSTLSLLLFNMKLLSCRT
jgi:hypothetical protein